MPVNKILNKLMRRQQLVNSFSYEASSISSEGTIGIRRVNTYIAKFKQQEFMDEYLTTLMVSLLFLWDMAHSLK